MTPQTLIAEINHLKGGGDGFRRAETVPFGAWRNKAGLVLTAATTPAITALETNYHGIVWVAANVDGLCLNWTVPGDYDQAKDELLIRMLACVADVNNAAVQMDASIYVKRAGTALTADLNPAAAPGNLPVAAAGPDATTKAAWVTITISGKLLKPGDALEILLYPTAHANDAVNLYSVELRYRSVLALYNESER